MNIKQLETVIAVVDAGSISEASRRLFATQPALTQQLNALESEIGFKLFERSRKGIVLTNAGEVFCIKAKKIIRLYNEAIREGRAAAESAPKRIRVAMTYDPPHLLMHESCKLFRERYPEIEIVVVTATLNGLLDTLLSGQSDLFASSEIQDVEKYGVRFLLLAQSPEYCCVPEGHRLCGRSLITFADLKGERVVFPPLGMSASADRVRDYIQREQKDINVGEVLPEYFKQNTVRINANLNNAILLTSGEFAGNTPPLVSIPLDWHQKSKLGLFYMNEHSEEIKKFIQCAKVVYNKAFGERN